MEWWIAVSELVRNFGLLAAAVIGLILGGMRVVAANRQGRASLRQAELARRDHVAELFNRAVAQLDDPKLQVRLGAIYTLRQIAHDFPDLAGAVLELLNVYMRVLRNVRNLTWDQLRDAVIDDTSKLPDYLRVIKPEPAVQVGSERINEAARGDVD